MVGTVLAIMTAAAAGLFGPSDADGHACAEMTAICVPEPADEASPPPVVDGRAEDTFAVELAVELAFELDRCVVPAPPPESRDDGCLDESFMASRTADSERKPQVVKPRPTRRGNAQWPALSTGHPAPPPSTAPAPIPTQPLALVALPTLEPPPGVPHRTPPPGEMCGDLTRRLERPPRA